MRSYLRGEAENDRSVEVEQVALAQLTIDHLPLFVQPALGRIVSALEHDVVALQSAGEVIPGGGDECILPLEVLDHLIGGSLRREWLDIGASWQVFISRTF